MPFFRKESIEIDPPSGECYENRVVAPSLTPDCYNKCVVEVTGNETPMKPNTERDMNISVCDDNGNFEAYTLQVYNRKVLLDYERTHFEPPLPDGRGYLDTVLGSLKLPVTLCLA